MAYDITLYQAGLFLVVHRAMGPLALGPLERSLAWQVPEVHAGQPLVATVNIGSLFWQEVCHSKRTFCVGMKMALGITAQAHA